MESFPKKKSRSQNDHEKFDRYVETEIQKGKTMSDICLEICKMRFKGSRIPFYDHYRYLSDSHRGYRPNGYKPTKTGRIMDERSELLPIKTLTSVVFSYMSGKKLDDENGKLMKLLQRADWFNQMYEATCSFC